jgi:hypothetical protein
MNTYGTRLGIIKQVLGLGYKDLLERLDNCVTDRSLRNYIENKTQMTGDLITMVPTAFPEIDRNWWHYGEGNMFKEPATLAPPDWGTAMVHEPDPVYGNKPGEDGTITIPAKELFHSLFKDMTEVNRLLQSRLAYYDIFIKNMDKYKI